MVQVLPAFSIWPPPLAAKDAEMETGSQELSRFTASSARETPN